MQANWTRRGDCDNFSNRWAANPPAGTAATICRKEQDVKNAIWTCATLASLLLVAGCITPPPLYTAAGRGDLATVTTLIDNGADVNQTGGGGLLNDSSALNAASGAGHYEVVKLLLEKGADVNRGSGNMGWTALSGAAWKGHTEVARLLIEHGADVDKAIAGLRKGVNTGRAVALLNQLRPGGAVTLAPAGNTPPPPVTPVTTTPAGEVPAY